MSASSEFILNEMFIQVFAALSIIVKSKIAVPISSYYISNNYLATGYIVLI